MRWWKFLFLTSFRACKAGGTEPARFRTVERLAPAPLPLGRRAAYRRVLAVLKAEKRRFLVGGGLGVSAHLARVVGEDLTVYLAPDDAAAGLAALATAGVKVGADPGGGRARVAYGPHAVDVAWALPAPLGGRLDEAWFAHDARTRLLDLRVRVAPLEELLWLRLAGRGAAVVGDAVVGEI